MEDFIFNPYVWLVVAAIAAIIEAASVSLITVWFVAGGIVAFFAGFFGGPLWAQLVIFLVVSLACLALLRPVILKYRKQGASHEPTLIGTEALVVEDIDAAAQTGRIEMPNRVTWIALSHDGSPIEKGARVRVIAQDSIKLTVERI